MNLSCIAVSITQKHALFYGIMKCVIQELILLQKCVADGLIHSFFYATNKREVERTCSLTSGNLMQIGGNEKNENCAKTTFVARRENEAYRDC
jgi:hypothetical protein